MTIPTPPNPHSRRSILRAAGMTLAAVGLPIGRAFAGNPKPALADKFPVPSKVPVFVELTTTRKFPARFFDLGKIGQYIGTVNRHPFGKADAGYLLLTGLHTGRDVTESGTVQHWISFTLIRRSMAWNDVIRTGGKIEGLRDSRGRSIYKMTDFAEVLPPAEILLSGPQSVTVEEYVVHVPKDTTA